jgi:hypothetical protein
MKKIIIGILLILSIFLLTGCGIYGQGKSTGYIYATDDGILWDKVWFKPDMASTESDCYLLNDNNLKEQLKNLQSNIKIEIYYDRHLLTLSSCGESKGSKDEIISYKIIETEQ